MLIRILYISCVMIENNVCISLTEILFVKIKSSFLSLNMVYG